ncbi:MAG: HD domain-containing protein [Deltaproteobacteria bacterium]|nr:HD domain-containing protein [Deltaproteobacteria bacterium]
MTSKQHENSTISAAPVFLQLAPFAIPALLQPLTDALIAAGGRPVVVGGAVRDHFLGLENKDIDLEVFSLSLDDVEAICARIGKVHSVGRSFGVLKVTVVNDDDEDTFDVALPRLENKVGRGHRGFVVESKPDMSFAEAALRRDFTINAIGWDVKKDELLDPHDGKVDLAARRLRHVSDAFDEDPLRVLRACQFAARFSMQLTSETLKKCRSIEPELASLPKERLWEEWKKLLLRSERPSVGLEVMRSTLALHLFPELEALIGCEQDELWHPEGDVWVHTLLVTDEAARICRDENVQDDDERMLILLGALCHDLGKPHTTKFIDGHIRSRGHESEGEAPTRSFLTRIGASLDVIEQVVPLVKEHLKPYMLYAERKKISDGALRRLSLRVPIPRLLLVSHADFCGRTTPKALTRVDPARIWLLEEATRLQVQKNAPKAILQGRHLIALGVKPGKAMGDVLKEAFDAQLDGDFVDEQEGLAWLKGKLVAKSSHSGAERPKDAS